MGAIFDEETGDEPSCMFCDDTEECSHMLACIDHTFVDCDGGVLYFHLDDFREILSTRVRESLDCKIKSKSVGNKIGKEIYQIIKDSTKEFDPNCPEDVCIDNRRFLDVLVDLFIAAGAEKPPGHIVEEGGPGFSSSLTLLYAENPEEIIKTVQERLKKTVAKI